jgi:hypothetical protein
MGLHFERAPCHALCLMVIARVRNTLPVRATISVRRTARCRTAVCIEGTAKHGERRPAHVSVEGKHPLIERNQLRCRRIAGTGYGIRSTQRKLL